ncbi:hypothetical protein BC6307_17835 [Sutcliffiella cohnii]|uniref:Uncharacterized protein n=1 Tax=Sutcliffiella cohnii TaxID=33932 RepID=A0A223KUI6_9BACI|nr:hypothetical protein [Sutcliffiella cohnii]AST92988.1 hypothetical protein BC6307_17835 [Sutcliffiella cohnii]
MHWVSFITGVVVTLFGYSLFTADKNEDEEDELLDEDVLVHDFQSRYVTLSCQSCRKLKRHREIEPNLFECTKCRRQTDVRVS